MEELFVLLGHPVAHSLSPAIHAAAFRAAGVDARYLALDVSDFAAGWAAVRRLAIRGGNVTVPWKEAACLALDAPSDTARRARSANTFWRTPGGAIAGADTDGEGFVRAVREELGLPLAGARAAILGAGGAGRAVAHAVAREGAAALYLWNRTPVRVARLIADLRAAGYGGELVELEEAEWDRAGGGAGTGATDVTRGRGRSPALPAGHAADLLVNATSLGLGRYDPPPADPRLFAGIRFAVDLVYGARPTPFVCACREARIRVADGRGMLLHQAACAFELWLGIPAPLGAMREALERGLAAAT